MREPKPAKVRQDQKNAPASGDGEVVTHENADGWCIDALQTAYINSLRVVTKPVAKVGSLDQHGCPFLAMEKGNAGEHILNVWAHAC